MRFGVLHAHVFGVSPDYCQHSAAIAVVGAGMDFCTMFCVQDTEAPNVGP